MGEHNIYEASNDQESQAFMRALLADLSALEWMLGTGQVENEPHRIGAEQEMFLIDRDLRPALVALELAREGAKAYGAEVLLAGILPTIQQSDLTLNNLTPMKGRKQAGARAASAP